MTFELSEQHTQTRDAARAFAARIAARAAEFDRAGAVPEEIAQEAARIAAGDAMTVVVAVEEIAAASAAVAVGAIVGSGGEMLQMSGLRGAKAPEESPRAQLALAAVALGVGRAAMDACLEELRRSNATPGADVEKPHWVVADVATEIDAARLLTYKAAMTSTPSDAGLARLMASAAAGHAVDAAVRIVGVAALAEGSQVERLSRDVRALSVLAGSEEEQRAVAAEGLLPH